MRNIFGMTECAGVIGVEPILAPRVPGSCGLRLPYTEVAVVAAVPAAAAPQQPGDGATGATGVLRVRGPNVMPGYVDERDNAGTLDAEGWLTTGDIGHVGPSGLIFITGRSKDIIIRSGHNIEPGVIEDALMRHRDVQFAAAVGEPDAYAGEIPVAFVVLKPGASLESAELLELIRPHIPEPPAIPRRVDVLPALPLTAVGKVYSGSSIRLSAWWCSSSRAWSRRSA
ncbi:MAG: AMP-binding protein, partial [Pseudomonadota bacterium]|nr:AMP-binding protein [Pseudomonadota bacterium]